MTTLDTVQLTEQLLELSPRAARARFVEELENGLSLVRGYHCSANPDIDVVRGIVFAHTPEVARHLGIGSVAQRQAIFTIRTMVSLLAQQSYPLVAEMLKGRPVSSKCWNQVLLGLRDWGRLDNEILELLLDQMRREVVPEHVREVIAAAGGQQALSRVLESYQLDQADPVMARRWIKLVESFAALTDEATALLLEVSQQKCGDKPTALARDVSRRFERRAQGY